MIKLQTLTPVKTPSTFSASFSSCRKSHFWKYTLKQLREKKENRHKLREASKLGYKGRQIEMLMTSSPETSLRKAPKRQTKWEWNLHAMPGTNFTPGCSFPSIPIANTPDQVEIQRGAQRRIRSDVVDIVFQTLLSRRDWTYHRKDAGRLPQDWFCELNFSAAFKFRSLWIKKSAEEDQETEFLENDGASLP